MTGGVLDVDNYTWEFNIIRGIHRSGIKYTFSITTHYLTCKWRFSSKHPLNFSSLRFLHWDWWSYQGFIQCLLRAPAEVAHPQNVYAFVPLKKLLFLPETSFSCFPDCEKHGNLWRHNPSMGGKERRSIPWGYSETTSQAKDQHEPRAAKTRSGQTLGPIHFNVSFRSCKLSLILCFSLLLFWLFFQMTSFCWLQSPT